MRSDIFKGQTCESFLTIGTCGLIFIVTGCGAPVGQIAARMDVSGKNLKIFRTVEQCVLILGMRFRYGYRGRDCRSNLHYLPTGEVAYFIAAVVVLYNIEEQMQRHYLGHSDDVKW